MRKPKYRRDLYLSLGEAKGWRSPLDVMPKVKKAAKRPPYDRNGHPII